MHKRRQLRLFFICNWQYVSCFGGLMHLKLISINYLQRIYRKPVSRATMHVGVIVLLLLLL